jgi:hypothetical protein
MAKPVCVTCLWEQKTEKTIDGSRTNTSWAKKIGVSEASIRRHRSHAPIVDQATSFNDGDGDELLMSIDVPEEYVTSRGMSLRDPVTGSWQKVTWQPNRKALNDTRSYEDLLDALEGWEPVGYSRRPDTTRRVAVLNMADLQIGKANQRWGGTPETLASARLSATRFVEHVIANGIRTVVLVDNGDPIENCFNVPAQLVTNDLSVPDQIKTFRRLMLEIIKLVAPHVDNLFYVTVPSNHGAHRTGYKSPGGTVDADFGVEISYALEDATSLSPYLEHIVYVRPRPLDETSELSVAGTKLAFSHGHQSGGVFRHGDWWKGMDHGRMAGWDADIFVFGHFHTQAVYQSGDGRWVVGTASSDPGSDWYTNRTGESSTRGMTAFDLDPEQPGVPLNIRIL